MADQKLDDLTAATTVEDDDLFYLVRDPGGTPLDRKITGADLKAAGGGSGWTLAVDQDGTSDAGWTSGSGTWASNGTIIQQTDTGASHRRFFYALNAMEFPALVEVEARIPATSGNSLQLAGLYGVADDGALWSANPRFGYESGTFKKELASAAELIRSTTDGAGAFSATWRKLRLHLSGLGATAWLDGALIATGVMGATSGEVASAVGGVALWSYGCAADFRDFKVWHHSLPA